MESPLLEVAIDGAQGVLFNVIGGTDLAMFEIDEAARMVNEAVDPNANVIFGASIDPELGEDIQVTILATGFDTTDDGSAIPTPKTTPEETPKAKQPERKPSLLEEDEPDYDVDALDSTPSFLRRNREY